MKFSSSVAVAFIMIGAVIISSSEAPASGLGCDNRQDIGVAADPNAISVDLTLPYGYLCHLVQSRGKDITGQRAAYTSSANIYGSLVDNICNWRIDFVYYGTNGDEYMRDKGDTVSDCKKGASRIIEKSKTLPQYGTTCAELIVDGELRLKQCHSMNE